PAPVCPRCGGTNQPHMRFCVHCGQALAAPAAPAAAPPAASPLAAPPPPASAFIAPTPFGAAPQAPLQSPQSPMQGFAPGGAVAPTPVGTSSPASPAARVEAVL